MNKKSILYIMDDINYPSGARQTTANQIKALAKEYDIWVFTGEEPDAFSQTLFAEVRFLQVPAMAELSCLNHTLVEVLTKPGFSFRQRTLKLLQAFAIVFGKQEAFFTHLYTARLANQWEDFDWVVCVSEASKFRTTASMLHKPRKVQWIHTDYMRWKQQSVWTRGVSAKDAKLYENFNYIVLLCKKFEQEFQALYPHLANKTRAIQNLVDTEHILQRAQAPLPFALPEDRPILLSLGRLEAEKNIPWMVEAAAFLRNNGYVFCWYLAGEGSLYGKIQKLILENQLQNYMVLTGPLKNPLPLLQKTSLLVLLSSYEGTPATIDEAMVLGVPIFSTDVGGIQEQVENSGGVRLADATLPACLVALEELLAENAQALAGMRSAAKDNRLQNPNAKTLCELRRLFEEKNDH